MKKNAPKLATKKTQAPAPIEIPAGMMLFEEFNRGGPVARFPRDSAGALRKADGRRTFTLQQAAKKFGWSEAALRSLYETSFNPFVPTTPPTAHQVRLAIQSIADIPDAAARAMLLLVEYAQGVEMLAVTVNGRLNELADKVGTPARDE